MTISLSQRLLAVGALCLLALIGLVVMEGRARASGIEVILRMRPIDPRALLTGHYVQFSFAEPLEPGEKCPPQATEPDDVKLLRSTPSAYWLALKPEGDVHVLVGEYATKAEALRQATVAARGRVRCEAMFVQTPGAADGGGADVAMVFLDLTVDRFHADQDEAEALERIFRDRDQIDRTAAILSVSEDGTVRTKGVIIDGNRVELTWF